MELIYYKYLIFILQRYVVFRQYRNVQHNYYILLILSIFDVANYLTLIAPFCLAPPLI